MPLTKSCVLTIIWRYENTKQLLAGQGARTAGEGGTLEKILPGVDKCLAPGGIVICESETGLVLPAEVGGMTLKKQYKYGKVLLWKYGKPRQSAGEGDAE